MFEQTFIQSQARPRNSWTVAVSLSLQCLIVAMVLLAPLLHTEALRLSDAPKPQLLRTWIHQPPLPPKLLPASASAAPVIRVPHAVFVYPAVHNTAAPQVAVPTGAPEPATWSGDGIAPFGIPGSDNVPVLPKAVPHPPVTLVPVKPVSNNPLRVGSGVQAARLLFGPRPAYPPLAKAARSQGIVKLEAIIAADGSIRNLRVVSGPPLLVDAAVNAVRQWRYQPTLLNGTAVEVMTEIEVNFTLSQ